MRIVQCTKKTEDNTLSGSKWKLAWEDLCSWSGQCRQKSMLCCQRANNSALKALQRWRRVIVQGLDVWKMLQQNVKWAHFNEFLAIGLHDFLYKNNIKSLYFDLQWKHYFLPLKISECNKRLNVLFCNMQFMLLLNDESSLMI